MERPSSALVVVISSPWEEVGGPSSPLEAGAGEVGGPSSPLEVEEVEEGAPSSPLEVEEVEEGVCAPC